LGASDGDRLQLQDPLYNTGVEWVEDVVMALKDVIARCQQGSPTPWTIIQLPMTFDKRRPNTTNKPSKVAKGFFGPTFARDESDDPDKDTEKKYSGEWTLPGTVSRRLIVENITIVTITT
jgi:hypothetical protein